ncbi:MAG: hypothetical protein R6U63_03665 [Longimicrobiales bacterium]
MRFRDPVCGMEIRWEEAVNYEVVGPVVVYFCCTGCATRFREDPAQHVDVHAWVEGGSRAETAPCGGEPLALQPQESSARRSRTLATAPQVGMLTLDEVEALVARHWRRLLDDDQGWLRTRTLERALLTFGLTGDGDRRKETDRLLAAEVARLRRREIDTERIEAELALLPRALATVLLDVTVGPTETAEFYETIEMKLAEIRPWVSARHAGPLRPARHARAPA